MSVSFLSPREKHLCQTHRHKDFSYIMPVFQKTAQYATKLIQAAWL